jgi:predicted membrane-bound spermidine synthase
MIFLAILSGLINLSSQTVFQKVVSMTVGDLYTTFMAVTLTFILGSALGSYYGHKIRFYLPWIEFGSGLYSLFIFLLLQGPFYELDIPLVFVILGLMPPAFALGTHIPLYSYYLRRVRFGLIYCLYHFGAVFGLLAFEWYFVHAGSVKLSVLIVGLSQVSLGALLLFLKKQGQFQVEKETELVSFKKLTQGFPRSFIAVFAASALSFYIVIWALKTQTMITEAFRMHATLISCAVFFWMAVAGLIAKVIKASTGTLMLVMAILAGFIYCFFPEVSLYLTMAYTGSTLNYFFLSQVLACYLTLPVLASALIFIQETKTLTEKKVDVDLASGSLNLLACVGNIAGFVVGALLAENFWNKEYFMIFMITATALGLVLRTKETKKVVLASLVILIAAFSATLKTDLKESLFANRVAPGRVSKDKISDIEVHSHVMSSMALYTFTPEDPKFKGARYYVVDGHLSHDIWNGGEFISGLSAAKYFNRPLNKAVVIGIGSGQAAWGVAAISKSADLVDVSPVVIKNLNILRQYNFDLEEKANAKIHLIDGFTYLRKCEPGTYDLILNTATYPSNFNAAKLYSDEMLALSTKCLTPDGVFQTYFDANTVVTMEQFYEFLAPFMKHFKFVDIMLEPYPQVYGYNTRRNIETFKKEDFIDAKDYEGFVTIHRADFEQACREFMRFVPPPDYVPRMNTLDRAYLERNSIENYIHFNDPNFPWLNLKSFYVPPKNQFGTFTCE